MLTTIAFMALSRPTRNVAYENDTDMMLERDPDINVRDGVKQAPLRNAAYQKNGDARFHATKEKC